MPFWYQRANNTRTTTPSDNSGCSFCTVDPHKKPQCKCQGQLQSRDTYLHFTPAPLMQSNWFGFCHSLRFYSYWLLFTTFFIVLKAFCSPSIRNWRQVQFLGLHTFYISNSLNPIILLCFTPTWDKSDTWTHEWYQSLFGCGCGWATQKWGLAGDTAGICLDEAESYCLDLVFPTKTHYINDFSDYNWRGS